jgi:phosphoglycerate dehydrogenase-like enzyme
VSRTVAWFADGVAAARAAGIGELPEEVVVVDAPSAEVQFAVPQSHAGFVPAQMPALEVVQARSAGVDWIVDQIPAGVVLCSARGTRDAAVAEWVVAALLADVKGVRPFAEAQAARRWDHDHGIFDLASLRVLLLGHGSIGRATQRLLEPFGCEVRGVARRARDGVAGLDELGTLLPWADAVVNLLPLTDATRGMVDAALLGSLRDGTLYVNAGRGATTDTSALLAELQTGRLRAVLDVVDPEPLPADHPLWDAPGVLISPHVAGDTPAGARASWALVGDQLRRHVRGEPLVNVVAGGY